MKAPTFSPSVEYPAAARRLGMALLLLLAYAWYARGRPLSIPSLRPASPPAEEPPPPQGRHVIIYSAGPDAAK